MTSSLVAALFVFSALSLTVGQGQQFDCPPEPTCPSQPAPYRPIDGSCNNPAHPRRGTAYQPHLRLVAANYADGVYEPARAESGAPMPNARKLSLALFGETEMQHPRNTLVSMQFGQLVAHDLSFTADVGGIQCCAAGKVVPREQASSRCLPIAVAPDDPVMAEEGVECMNMVRTRTTLEDSCSGAPQDGAAEQLTSVTAFLDLSVVYGNTRAHSDSLRSFTDGQLRMERRHGVDWPPRHPNATRVCHLETEAEVCYLTGDNRSNQSPHLALLQQAFALEHNRLARELSAVAPVGWDDERLFQEARRINIAQYQSIVYYEWLPIYLGRDNMVAYGVLPETTTADHVRDYDSGVDPTVSNAFATAALRFFHNLIAGHLDLVEESRQPTGSIRLSDWIDKPSVLEMEGKYEDLSRGMVAQPHDRPNNHLTPEMKHFLFRRGRPVGVDLKALDIQRSRDHGLASYNAYREHCGLPRVTDWERFTELLRPTSAELLPTLYASVNDVELAVAGALERHHGGGMAGETYNCLLLDQFRRTRVADWYFFENGNTFPVRQLYEIRKASMARLLCDNTVGLTEIQQQAFFLTTDTNPVVPCRELPSLNLSRWPTLVGV